MLHQQHSVTWALNLQALPGGEEKREEGGGKKKGGGRGRRKKEGEKREGDKMVSTSLIYL